MKNKVKVFIALTLFMFSVISLNISSVSAVADTMPGATTALRSLESLESGNKLVEDAVVT